MKKEHHGKFSQMSIKVRNKTKDNATPYVRVQVDRDAQLCALLDTGAAFSLIGKSTYDQLSGKQMSSVKIQCQGVSGEKVSILGETDLNVCIGRESQRHRFLVVEGLVVPMILGIDFMSKLGKLTIDLDGNSLTIHRCKSVVSLLFEVEMGAPNLKSVDARLSEDITIKPLTEMLVKCDIPNSTSYPYLVEKCTNIQLSCTANMCNSSSKRRASDFTISKCQ